MEALKRKAKKFWRKLERGMEEYDTDYGMPWFKDFNPEEGFQIATAEERLAKRRGRPKRKKKQKKR